MYRREQLENTIMNTLNSKAEEINPRGGMGERVKSAVISGTQKSSSIPRRPRAIYGYVAAVLLLFVSINTVYADDISQIIKSFFNKTPVYSTMVEGKAYYLKEPLELNKDLRVDSIVIAEGKLNMNLTAQTNSAMNDVKILPKTTPGIEYIPECYGKDGDNSYSLSFKDAKERTTDIKPFQTFDLQIGGKTYPISLAEAKTLDASQKIAVSDAAANKIDLVTVGANSTIKNGKQSVQFLVSFKNKDMKLAFLGQPEAGPSIHWYEDMCGKGPIPEPGVLGGAQSPDIEPIYAIDQSGVKHQLAAPKDVKVYPITNWGTDASPDNQLTVKLPALIAFWESRSTEFTVNIPKEGEQVLNQELDLFAQKAVASKVKRLSPTSAELTFRLNTGANKNIIIQQFVLENPDIKKCKGQFNGDTAVFTLDFKKEIDTFSTYADGLAIIMKGNWTINLK